MDSVSQFALGAAVGVAVMGRRTAPWKAALWGGVCGTLPDLDALIDYGDAVSNMTLHRAETHSIFWQTLASPPIAAAIAALDRGSAPFRRSFPWWLLTVWLALVTHALLDGMTVYGTQLGLPFTDRPFGLGSIFIIDPLYTIPLLVGLIVAVRAKRPSARNWNTAGLVLSTAYLAWSAGAQRHVAEIVANELASRPAGQNTRVERILVTPSPLNTVLWRVLVMHPDGYEEGFYSLLDGDRPIRFSRFPRDAALYEQTRSFPGVARIAWFSHGFFRVDERDGVVRITDLRMGQEPFYVFSFAVGKRASPPQPIVPQAIGERADVAATLRWIRRRAAGEDVEPPR